MTITQRLDAVTAIPERYRGEVLPAPQSVKIELTADCNYHCTYCVKSLRMESGEMDRALYSRLIRELRDAGVEELGIFYIGESFLCKWLPAAIREAKDIGFPYVFCTTNGSAATPQRVEACMLAGLDSLKFSLNFADRAQLAEIAGVAPSVWNRVIYNIESARRIRDGGRYACGLYASSIELDGTQGERMLELVEQIRLFVDEHYWLPCFPMDGAAKASGRQPTAGNPGRVGVKRDPLPCWAVTTGHITHDGLLAACCFGAGLDGSLVMGDLKTTPFMSAWNNAAFRALRRAHWARDVRGTGCEACIAG